MSRNINNEDFAILLALESNPFKPMVELAKQLGITRVTAKKRVDSLKARGIIMNPVAIYDQHALGLYRINVITTFKTIDNLMLMEKACDEHPYTNYRVRAFGGSFKLYIQFNIPDGTLNHLEEFLDKLQKQKIIEEYQVHPSTEVRLTIYPDLERYDTTNSKWDFSWKEWFSKLFTSKKTKLEKPEINKDFSSFNQSHFKVLRLLTADCSLKQTDLIDKLHLSKTQAHREYNFVMNNYIKNTRLIYNREVFDLTETYLAIVQDIPKEKLAQIYHSINTNPPPFRLSADILENNALMIWCNLSSLQASAFAFSLWEIFETAKVYILDTKKSGIYWFYPENFDFQKMKWKTDKSYMIEEPIDRLNKYLKA